MTLSLRGYGVPEQEIQQALAFLRTMDLRAVGQRTIERLFHALEMRYDFQLGAASCRRKGGEHMRKRLVSILMALCMAVSLLPVQALAADDAYTVGEDTRAKVRLYSGSLVPEENCATLTLADGTVTVYIHTEERLPVVLADTSGKYVGGDLTIYQDVSKPLTIHKAAKSITVADGKRVSELIIAGDANVTITGGRYSKVTVETGGVLQLRGGAVDSLIIKSEGHVSVMDSIVNSVTREDGAHFLGTADREVTTAQGLAAALADSEVSKVILTADVQLTGSRLDVSRYVPVDLNGHVLRSNGSNIVFWVGNGGYLELNDSDPESTHSDFSVQGRHHHRR